MNERSQSRETDPIEAWKSIEESVNRAAQLYLHELGVYLNWTRDVQREILAESLLTAQRFSRFQESQLAFLARLRDSAPAIGGMPSGTETVAGMVDAVVRETGGAAQPHGSR